MKNILKIKIDNNLINQIIMVILFIIILISSAVTEENISVGITAIIITLFLRNVISMAPYPHLCTPIILIICSHIM